MSTSINAVANRDRRPTPSCLCNGTNASKSSPSVSPAGRYIIYDLRELATDRHYVGLSARSLAQRISAHLSQARRDKPIRPGGLMAALRGMLEIGWTFPEAWDSRIVARTDDLDQARALERHWAAKLSAQSPQGYNLMPAGSSVGGPGNTLPVTIELPGGLRRSYASIQEAIADLDHGAKSEGRPVISSATVYYRLSRGWSAAAAFGFVPRQDGRGQRLPFHLGGETYTTLRAAAADTGIPCAALRSRLHRLPKEAAGQQEIGTDRRASASGGSPLDIPWPPTGERLTAQAFSHRTGIAKSTVIHRYHQAMRHVARYGALVPAALYRWIMQGVDRRHVLMVALPNGSIWTGGERELIRRVLADLQLEARRPCRLSASGMRRRLRLLSARDRQDPGMVAEAFGLVRVTQGEI